MMTIVALLLLTILIAIAAESFNWIQVDEDTRFVKLRLRQ